MFALLNGGDALPYCSCFFFAFSQFLSLQPDLFDGFFFLSNKFTRFFFTTNPNKHTGPPVLSFRPCGPRQTSFKSNLAFFFSFQLPFLTLFRIGRFFPFLVQTKTLFFRRVRVLYDSSGIPGCRPTGPALLGHFVPVPSVLSFSIPLL